MAHLSTRLRAAARLLPVLGLAAAVAACQKPAAPRQGLSAPIEHLAGWTGATASFAPNPAPGDLTVAFTLPRPGRARVQLLDVAGRAVVDRTLDGLPGGRHTERIAARGDVPAGVYLVRVEFDGERRTRTAIVVH